MNEEEKITLEKLLSIIDGNPRIRLVSAEDKNICSFLKEDLGASAFADCEVVKISGMVGTVGCVIWVNYEEVEESVQEEEEP